MEYKFNDCGVCINPTIYGEIRIKKHLVLTNEIRIAQLPTGKWVFGWTYESDNLDGVGGGMGCSSYSSSHFDTKHLAVIAAAKKMRETAAKNAAYYRTPYKKLLECADAAEKQLFDEGQLSLF